MTRGSPLTNFAHFFSSVLPDSSLGLQKNDRVLLDSRSCACLVCRSPPVLTRYTHLSAPDSSLLVCVAVTFFSVASLEDALRPNIANQKPARSEVSLNRRAYPLKKVDALAKHHLLVGWYFPSITSRRSPFCNPLRPKMLETPRQY